MEEIFDGVYVPFIHRLWYADLLTSGTACASGSRISFASTNYENATSNA